MPQFSLKFSVYWEKTYSNVGCGFCEVTNDVRPPVHHFIHTPPPPPLNNANALK